MAPDLAEKREGRSAARIQALRWHFIAYAVVVACLVVANFLVWPGEPWFVWPLVGWGGVLAVHVAFVMGLFDRE